MTIFQQVFLHPFIKYLSYFLLFCIFVIGSHTGHGFPYAHILYILHGVLSPFLFFKELFSLTDIFQIIAILAVYLSPFLFFVLFKVKFVFRLFITFLVFLIYPFIEMISTLTYRYKQPDTTHILLVIGISIFLSCLSALVFVWVWQRVVIEKKYYYSFSILLPTLLFLNSNTAWDQKSNWMFQMYVWLGNTIAIATNLKLNIFFYGYTDFLLLFITTLLFIGITLQVIFLDLCNLIIPKKNNSKKL